MGNAIIGISNSLALDLITNTDRLDITVTKARFPIVIDAKSKIKFIFKLNRAKKIGKIVISIKMIKIQLYMIFPTKIVEGLIGLTFSPLRVSISASFKKALE